MKGFPTAHIFHPSIPPMHTVVNNHNRNIDYWTVKRKFAEIVSTNDVNKIYSISNELRRVGNDSNLLIVFYVQIMPDDFVMQLHR
ncbi:hypothetical protein P4I40_21750, partial [Escherichia coli]